MKKAFHNMCPRFPSPLLWRGWGRPLVYLLALATLTSCYSYLRADKLVYAGSIAKKIDTVVLDSLANVELHAE